MAITVIVSVSNKLWLTFGLIKPRIFVRKEMAKKMRKIKRMR